MKKTELIKEQQERFQWLMDAETEDENVEVKRGILHWKGGIWKNGTWNGSGHLNGWWIKELLFGTSENHVNWCGIWENGTWKNGVWNGGRWLNGVWENGVWNGGRWLNGVWENGTWLKSNSERDSFNRFSEKDYWENGTWKNGVWNGGSWINGVWKNGTWKNGTWRNGLWENGKTK